MKLELSEKLYTEITKKTLTTYKGISTYNEEGEFVILVTWEDIEPMLEDLIGEIMYRDEKIQDLEIAILNQEN